MRNLGRRHVEEGLDRALHEKPRPGHRPALSPGQAQRIVAMVCGPPPEGQARWSVRLIAAEAMRRHLVAPTTGPETIRVLLRQHDLNGSSGKSCGLGQERDAGLSARPMTAPSPQAKGWRCAFQ